MISDDSSQSAGETAMDDEDRNFAPAPGAAGKSKPPQPGPDHDHHTESALTVANAISVSRVLALVPLIVFVRRQEYVLAAAVLAYIGISDYLDGLVARHLRHVSPLGAILDPVCDRIALGGSVVVLLAYEVIPRPLGFILIFREAVVSIGTIALGIAGWPRIRATWAGKAATLMLMFAVPLFVGASAELPTADLARLAAWAFAIPGTILYYYAMGEYIVIAIRLRHHRRERTGRIERSSTEPPC